MTPAPPAYPLLGVLAVSFGLVVALMVGLLAAGRYPPNVGLVISLSLLTLLALVGFMSTGNDTLGAIAAGGVGALAAAVSGTWGRPTTPPKERPDDEDRI